MIHTIIIEDEEPALDNLVKTCEGLIFPIRITTVLRSVREAIQYLSAHPTAADLILSDVQLGDGLSFSIFKEVDVKMPVIFITGYDEFMMSAFEHNGIDYLLKPVSQKELSKAIYKFQKLKDHFTDTHKPIQKLIQTLDGDSKSRIMVKRGIESIPMRLTDVALFYTENKVVYAWDRDGRKYLYDKSLGDLEEELSREQFFRANRQYLINIDYIKSYRPFDKLKLQVDIQLSDSKHSVIVSQENASHFKRWING